MMINFNSTKLENAVKVIEYQLRNENPCTVLDVKDVNEAYSNILYCLKALQESGQVKWYHYFDDYDPKRDKE